MEKLFLQILNMSISATYLILAIVAIRFLLKKTPKWINVLLWGLVAVRLLCPFTPESMFSLIPKAQAVSPEILTPQVPSTNLGGGSFESGEIGTMGEIAGTGTIGESPEILAPEVPNTNLGGGSFESGEIETMGEIAGTGTIGESPVLPPVSDVESLPSAPVSDAVDPQNVMAVLAVIWAAGVVVMLAYVAYSYGRIRKKVGMAVPMGNGIYQSDQIDSAFVLGILKPKIYLPFSLKEKNINHVVSHERAHIRRRDHLWKPLGFLLLALHWFNPFMWVGYILLCHDIELACDEKVIGELGYMERAEYSEVLLSCSVNRRMVFACPVAFGEINMKGRVKSVLNYQKPTFKIICLSLVACMLLSVCFLTNPVSATEADPQEESEIMEEAPAEEFVLPEDSDPLLVLWHEFIVTEEREVKAIGSRGVFNLFSCRAKDTVCIMIIPIENVICKTVEYLQSLDISFVGVREMDEKWCSQFGIGYVNRKYDVHALMDSDSMDDCENALFFTVMKDGTFIIQDENRMVEMYTAPGAVDYAEFWSYFSYLNL